MRKKKTKQKKLTLRERRPGLFAAVSPERTAKRRARTVRQDREMRAGKPGYIPEAHPTKKLTLGRLWAAGRTPAALRMRDAQDHYALLLQLLYGGAMRPAATGALGKVWVNYWEQVRQKKLERAMQPKHKGRSFLKRKFGIM